MSFTDAEFEAALEHFGVKGMHWGVRRDRSSGGIVRTPAEQELHDINVKSVKVGVGVGLGLTLLTAGIGLPVAALVGTGAGFATKHYAVKASSFSGTQKATGKATVDKLIKNQGKK